MTIPTPANAIEQRDGEPDLNAEAEETHRQLVALADLTKPSSEIKATIDQLSVTAEAPPLNVDELAVWLDSQIPVEVLKTAPTNQTAFDLLQWKIKAASFAIAKPTVPVTDTARPSLSLAATDLATLPAHTRMAHGYANTRKG